MKLVCASSLLVLTLISFSCAGKPVTPKKKLRYIPEEKKILYISTIYNRTASKGLETELRSHLIDYFFSSDEATYSLNLGDLRFVSGSRNQRISNRCHCPLSSPPAKNEVLNELNSKHQRHFI